MIELKHIEAFLSVGEGRGSEEVGAQRQNAEKSKFETLKLTHRKRLMMQKCAIFERALIYPTPVPSPA